jgi:glycosyltransferase involved in cell wall biosynthesis
MANAFADDGYSVSAILMRRLLPKRLYPGRLRVGSALTDLSYSADITVIDGVDYYWVPSLLRALRHLWRERPQAVVFEWWTSTVVHTYLVLAIVARLLGARVVVEFHETLDTAEARMLIPGIYAKMMLRPILRLAQGFAVHSTFDRDAIASHYPLGDRPIVVVRHGPYDHFVPTGTTEDRSAGPCRLLYFGTIRPYKGVEDLIEAFSGLTEAEAQQYRLTVVGETWEGWNRPAELIANSPHRDLITFVNRYVSDAEAEGFFTQSDVVVLPYLRSSASGPLHIAMSFGLPVIVTAVGGLSEAAGDYEGTILVPPQNVEQLRLAIRNVKTVANERYSDPFTWTDSARQLAVLFGDGHVAGPGRTSLVSHDVERDGAQ